jgi:hypothetical protein
MAAEVAAAKDSATTRMGRILEGMRGERYGSAVYDRLYILVPKYGTHRAHDCAPGMNGEP